MQRCCKPPRLINEGIFAIIKNQIYQTSQLTSQMSDDEMVSTCKNLNNVNTCPEQNVPGLYSPSCLQRVTKIKTTSEECFYFSYFITIYMILYMKKFIHFRMIIYVIFLLLRTAALKLQVL